MVSVSRPSGDALQSSISQRRTAGTARPLKLRAMMTFVQGGRSAAIAKDAKAVHQRRIRLGVFRQSKRPTTREHAHPENLLTRTTSSVTHGSLPKRRQRRIAIIAVCRPDSGRIVLGRAVVSRCLRRRLQADDTQLHSRSDARLPWLARRRSFQQGKRPPLDQSHDSGSFSQSTVPRSVKSNRHQG